MKAREQSNIGSKTIYIDIMKDERFIFTLKYKYCPLFKIDIGDIYNEVVKKRPTLKNTKFEIYIDD